jgi:hypothetical protein
VELGATALDSFDGDLTGSIVIDATGVDTAVLGSYAVTYDVTDSSGNPAIQVSRVVDVVDTTVPVITLVGADPQFVEAGSLYVELGATALDSFDGDLTGSISIDATAVNTAVLGSYTVTYDVVDSSGNPAIQVTRVIDVADTTVPVITLVGPDPQIVEIDTPYVELGAIASDSFEGDLTSSIIVDATGVDTTTVGSYPVLYDVADSSGNPAVGVSRTVGVVDTNDPPVLDPVGVITVGEGTVVVFAGSASDPEAHTLTYHISGAPAGAVIDPVTGNFRWVTSESDGPGTYVFTLSVTDDGFPALTTATEVTINVAEANTAPIVTPVADQSSFEDDEITLTVTGSDIDVPANTLTWSAIGLPDNLTIDPVTGVITGRISATAATGSPYTVTVGLTDDGSPTLTSTTTFEWVVHATPNQPPTATDDTYSVTAGGTLTVGAPGVLNNDTDGNSDTLTATLETGPATGTLTFNNNGSFTYTTNDVAEGATVTFTYRLDDGYGGTATATVTISITPNGAPNAVDDSATLTTYISRVIDILGNDNDPETDPLTITAIIPSDNMTGRVDINADGTITYHPRAGFVGVETFTYIIADTNNNQATATVTINIPEVVNTNSLTITETLGTNNVPFTSPPSDIALDAIGLEIGSVTLITQAFFQSIDALRVPLAFLIFSVLAVIILGGFTELPTLIAGRRRRYWSVILLNREATLPVRAQPSYDADIIYRYAPTTTGIISHDKAQGTFLNIDTPRGNGYIDTAYLTPTVDLDHFLTDPRPIDIVHQLTEALNNSNDITRYISPRGLIIAITDQPLLITPQHLIGNLKETNPTTETAAVALQIDLFEELRQALNNTPTINHNTAHSRNALIPIELWNLPYLAIQAPNHNPWLIHFEYHNNKPHIAAINLDQ